MKIKLIPICLMAATSLFAADDDRASRDNADSARDSHDSGGGQALDCCGYDWGNTDRDSNQPGNDNERTGTIPMCGDSKD